MATERDSSTGDVRELSPGGGREIAAIGELATPLLSVLLSFMVVAIWWLG